MSAVCISAGHIRRGTMCVASSITYEAQNGSIVNRAKAVFIAAVEYLHFRDSREERAFMEYAAQRNPSTRGELKLVRH